MIISFGGLPGAGKSGIAERLADELGWPHYDLGKVRRQCAHDRGMTMEEYNTLGETDPSTDTDVDNYQAKLGREQDNFVIVGRTSWHFIPHSLKIFLKARTEVGAQRIIKDLKSRNEPNIKSLDDMMGVLKRRYASDSKRFKEYYGIELYDDNHYDWTFDTSDVDQETAYQTVLAYVKTKLSVS